MTPLADALRRTAEQLRPQRDALVEGWTRALAAGTGDPEARSFCERGVDALLDRLGRGEAEEMLREEAVEAAAAAARTGEALSNLHERTRAALGVAVAREQSELFRARQPAARIDGERLLERSERGPVPLRFRAHLAQLEPERDGLGPGRVTTCSGRGPG